MSIEVLAPVGNLEMYYAAVEAGADAVFLACKDFGARAYANNFDLKEIEEIVRMSKVRGIKVHVTVNTLIKEDELLEALELIRDLEMLGVDAVIVQDLGLLRLAKNYAPSLDYHISTQVSASNSRAVNFLEEMGAKRVILARELNINQINNICKNTKVDLEVFGHGSLCVSYSGKCTMSSFIGGRSGNRGRCAQPCRKEYELLKPNKDLIQKGFFLSPLDLAIREDAKTLEKMGIKSVKIEGRMKKPEYVYSTVRYYKDLLQGGNPEEDLLTEVSNRGFTKGIFRGDRGKNFADPYGSATRGSFVGRIKSDGDKYIDLKRDIGQRDSLEIELKSKKFTITSSKAYKAGEKLYLDKFPDALVGSEVYRISKGSLNNYSFEENFKRLDLPVDMVLKARVGEYPNLDFKTDSYFVLVSLDEKLEEAKKAPLNKDYAEKQLSKLGETDFKLNNLVVETDGKSFMPASILNKLRRLAVANLFKKRRREDEIILGPHDEVGQNDLKIGAFRRGKDIKDFKADSYILDCLDDDIDGLGDKEIFYKLPLVMNDEDYDKERSYIENNIDKIQGLVVSNPWDIGFAKEFEGLKVIYSEYGNTFNTETCKLAKDLGVDLLILSKELSLEEISDIKKVLPIAYDIFSRPIEMIMDHCPFSLLGCDFNCENCKYSKGHYLRNENGDTYVYERWKDMSLLKNEYPIDERNYEKHLRNLGIKTFIYSIDMERDVDYLNGLTDDKTICGHLEKGVL